MPSQHNQRKMIIILPIQKIIHQIRLLIHTKATACFLVASQSLGKAGLYAYTNYTALLMLRSYIQYNKFDSDSALQTQTTEEHTLNFALSTSIGIAFLLRTLALYSPKVWHNFVEKRHDNQINDDRHYALSTHFFVIGTAFANACSGYVGMLFLGGVFKMANLLTQCLAFTVALGNFGGEYCLGGNAIKDTAGTRDIFTTLFDSKTYRTRDSQPSHPVIKTLLTLLLIGEVIGEGNAMIFLAVEQCKNLDWRRYIVLAIGIWCAISTSVRTLLLYGANMLQTSLADQTKLPLAAIMMTLPVVVLSAFAKLSSGISGSVDFGRLIHLEHPLETAGNITSAAILCFYCWLSLSASISEPYLSAKPIQRAWCRLFAKGTTATEKSINHQEALPLLKD